MTANSSDGRADRDDRGMDEADLAEVIRLQAEALARISGRMSGHRTGAVPAPQAGRGRSEAGDVLLALRRDERESSLPALGDDPSLSADSMPVLNAFKKFLETERRRTRRRMIEAGILVVLLLVGILTGAFLAARRQIEQLSSEVRNQRKAADIARRDTESELRSVAWMSEQLRTASESAAAEAQQVRAGTAELRRELTNQVRHAQTQLLSRLEFQSAEVEKLVDALTSLQVENAMLQNSLREVRDLRGLTPPASEAAGSEEESPGPEEISPRPGEEPTTSADAGPSRAAPAACAPEDHSLPLVIIPSNMSRAVEFRLPLVP